MKYSLNIDVYSELDMQDEVPTLGSLVYVGTNDEPVTHKESFEFVLASLIDAHEIPGGTMSKEDKKFLLKMMRTIRSLCKDYMEYTRGFPTEKEEKDEVLED